MPTHATELSGDHPGYLAKWSLFTKWSLERELGKAAALVPNLCPNESDPQSIGESSKDNFQREPPCGTSSQSDSEVLQDDQETSAEWKFEGHIYFSAGRWSSGKNFEDAVRAVVEDQIPTNIYQSCSCPSYGIFLQSGCRTQQGIVETTDLRLCTGKIC